MIPLFGLAAFLYFPTGPGKQVEGTVQSLGFREDYEGSYPLAIVQVEDGTKVTVLLRRRDLCRIGDRIRMIERPVALGRRYIARTNACPGP